MTDLMTFAFSLVKKLRGAKPLVRDRLRSFLREYTDKGVLPLGIHTDAVGDDAYWWVVFDPSRFPSDDKRMDYVEGRSPRGMKVVVLEI